MGNMKSMIKNQNQNEEPAPTQTEDGNTKGPKFIDLPEKRKFAEFLLSSDLNIFKKHLPEVRRLNDEEFNALFEGNIDYKFNVQNEKAFRQLVQKFEDNNDLIMEAYSNKKYHDLVSPIWRANILQKLKEMEDDAEKNTLLKKYNINTSNWDDNFRDIFTIIVNTAPIKTLAERMKNYFSADYGDFDELIKNSTNCKKTAEKNDESYCNKTLNANIDTSMSRIIKTFIPDFMKKIKKEIENLPENLKKKDEEMAIMTIVNSKLSKGNEKKLIQKVMKIYREKTSYNFFGYNKECEKLKILFQRFNAEDGKYAWSQGKVHFKEMNFADKAEFGFSNKIIKHAVLGLSVANLAYSVMHLTKTFLDYENFNLEFREKLNSIKQKFMRHQQEVKLIPEDVDLAIEQIIDCSKKFSQDLQEVEELMAGINEAINGVRNEKNKSIFNMIGSGGGAIISLFAASVTKGDDSIEYATASLSDVLAFASNCADLKMQKEAIKRYKEYFSEAEKLEGQILQEIDKLRQKFNELSGKHYS